MRVAPTSGVVVNADKYMYMGTACLPERLSWRLEVELAARGVNWRLERELAASRGAQVERVAACTGGALDDLLLAHDLDSSRFCGAVPALSRHLQI
jgi:hypothetical protein